MATVTIQKTPGTTDRQAMQSAAELLTIQLLKAAIREDWEGVHACADGVKELAAALQQPEPAGGRMAFGNDHYIGGE